MFWNWNKMTLCLFPMPAAIENVSVGSNWWWKTLGEITKWQYFAGKKRIQQSWLGATETINESFCWKYLQPGTSCGMYGSGTLASTCNLSLPSSKTILTSSLSSTMQVIPCDFCKSSCVALTKITDATMEVKKNKNKQIETPRWVLIKKHGGRNNNVTKNLQNYA